jgi:hypothetical protein
MSVHDLLRSLAPFVEFHHDRFNVLRRSPSQDCLGNFPHYTRTVILQDALQSLLFHPRHLQILMLKS